MSEVKVKKETTSRTLPRWRTGERSVSAGLGPDGGSLTGTEAAEPAKHGRPLNLNMFRCWSAAPQPDTSRRKVRLHRRYRIRPRIGSGRATFRSFGQTIKELCQQFPHGITDQVIQNDMPHLEPQQRAMAINKLLSLVRSAGLLRNSAGLLYRMKDTQTSRNLEQDIRFKSNLPLTEINKILKNWRARSSSGRQASKKKVYMLYNLQPDRSVTGGAWYSDQDFESEFVEAEAARDSKQSPMVQRNSSFATSHEVWKYICELGISKVPQVDLSMDDIETILNTLIYDGKVEMTVIAAKEGTVGSVDGQMKLYRGVNAIIQPTGLVKTPCGLCPVFDDCHEGGEISPSNCVYMSEWLDF
ncbi:hypothetical protein INR49_008127 [Caranx melampygus]|nr:hypothetical protein INR49_008127 [Caranx melampygus]